MCKSKHGRQYLLILPICVRINSTIKRAVSARLGKRGFICTLEFYKSFIMLYLWMGFCFQIVVAFLLFFCRGDRYVLLAV